MRWRWAVSVVATGALAATVLAPAASSSKAPRPPHLGSGAIVSIDPAAAIAPPVPGDFLGLSFEAEDLNTLAGYGDDGEFVNLLRSLGPGVMRFGGISSDRNTAWLSEGTPPPWASSTITPGDLAGLASLARSTGWHILLGVNLGHFEPAAAAQEAQVADTVLGPSLAGIAIGNEPDRYLADLLRPAGWSPAGYVSESEAYRAAIAAAAPAVALMGPDASSGKASLPWLTAVAASERPALLTYHYYPLTSCGRYKPTSSDLLSPLTRAHEQATLTALAVIAQAYALPLRLDETNNISCRGQPGLSNTFSSALWAVDYIVRAMASGVTGLNFHDLIADSHAYSPLAARNEQELKDGVLHANPEWYALLLARRLLGDQPIQEKVKSGNRNLTSAAFLSASGRLHIVLVNFSSLGKPVSVSLHVPRDFGGGTILRLAAPGLRATSQVTLGGRAVSAEGTWTPGPSLPHVAARAGSLNVEMPKGSAALLTLYPTS